MKRRTILIISAVGIVVVLIAIAALALQNQSASAAATVRVQTSTVQRGSLVATVSAAGNISVLEEASLAFQTNGRVAKVNVLVGDAVKAGQVLMELDTTDLNLALRTAQTNLASAQANFDQTKTNLDFALRNAQANLSNAQSNLAAAKAKNDQNPNALIIAKAALDKAQVALQKAQGDYNAIAWRGDIGMTTQAATLQQATIDYNSALASYNQTAATINDTALKQAQTQLSLDQVALEQAQRNLDTNLRTAQASLDNAKLSVEQAQRNLDKSRIIAPFDGVVSVVNNKVNDSVASAVAVGVVNPNRLQVKVTVAEVDLPKIKANNTAQLTLDALTGKTYSAKVMTIGPVGTVTQGVVNYPVTLEITNVDGAIKPGMTANLAIVVERRDNVLLLPTRAVRTQGNQKTVTVQYKGQSITQNVTTGLTNDTSVEIISGLQEGDVVLLNQTTTRQTGNVPGGPGGIPFFGGR